VSANDALREKLIDEAVTLRLSVKAIRLSDELPDMLRMYKFDWVILDLEADEAARLTITRTLSRHSAQAGIVLVSQDEIVLASARATSAANGLKVVGVLSRAFSPTALGTALGRRVRGRAGRAGSNFRPAQVDPGGSDRHPLSARHRHRRPQDPERRSARALATPTAWIAEAR
jgi:DNA-binding NarL/FixJ family response regulator